MMLRLLSVVSLLGLFPTAPAIAYFPTDVMEPDSAAMEPFADPGSAEPTMVEAMTESDGDTLTRAEFTRLAIDALYPPEYIDSCFSRISPSLYSLLFSDLRKDDWYAKYVCTGMTTGILHGNKDGTFDGDRMVNLAEGSKILSRAFGLPYPFGLVVPGEAWYVPYVKDLASQSVLPTSFTRFDQSITQAQAEEMINRLLWDIRDRPAVRFETLR